jgi:DNA-binding transcriptional LysR family regulator
VPELRDLDQVASGAPTMFRSNSIPPSRRRSPPGLDFGVLHKFAAPQDSRLVRVLSEALDLKRSYWLCARANQARIPRAHAVMDFLADLTAARHKNL